MKQEPKPGKRIVSKGEYVAVQTSRAVLRTSALVSVAEVVICAILAVYLPILNFGLLGWLAALFFAAMGFRLGCLGLGKLKMIAQLEEVLPLNQANTALLPPTQTLVRASSPPPQELQHVLLRATEEEQETPADQLLRSAVGLANVSSEGVQAQETVLQRVVMGATQEEQEALLLRTTIGVQE